MWLLAGHEMACLIRDPVADAAVPGNDDPEAAMSMASPFGCAIRTTSPFRRATVLAAVSSPDVRSHLSSRPPAGWR